MSFWELEVNQVNDYETLEKARDSLVSVIGMYNEIIKLLTPEQARSIVDQNAHEYLLTEAQVDVEHLNGLLERL
jgi:hypothetical protein